MSGHGRQPAPGGRGTTRRRIRPSRPAAARAGRRGSRRRPAVLVHHHGHHSAARGDGDAGGNRTEHFAADRTHGAGRRSPLACRGIGRHVCTRGCGHTARSGSPAAADRVQAGDIGLAVQAGGIGQSFRLPPRHSTRRGSSSSMSSAGSATPARRRNSATSPRPWASPTICPRTVTRRPPEGVGGCTMTGGCSVMPTACAGLRSRARRRAPPSTGVKRDEHRAKRSVTLWMSPTRPPDGGLGFSMPRRSAARLPAAANFETQSTPR